MATTIILEPRPHSSSPEYPYYAALVMAISGHLTARGWLSEFDLGDSRGDTQSPDEQEHSVTVHSGNTYEIMSYLKLLPYVRDVVNEGFVITVTINTYVPATGQTMRLPALSPTQRFIGFPHPLGGWAVAEGLILTRAGFTVTGFFILDGAVVATFSGAMTADGAKRLAAVYEEIDNILTEETATANMFGERIEGSSIMFPGGIPLEAWEAAFVYVQAGVPVIGFVLTNGVYEPHACGPLGPELLDALAQQFTLEL